MCLCVLAVVFYDVVVLFNLFAEVRGLDIMYFSCSVFFRVVLFVVMSLSVLFMLSPSLLLILPRRVAS